MGATASAWATYANSQSRTHQEPLQHKVVGLLRGGAAQGDALSPHHLHQRGHRHVHLGPDTWGQRMSSLLLPPARGSSRLTLLLQTQTLALSLLISAPHTPAFLPSLPCRPGSPSAVRDLVVFAPCPGVGLLPSPLASPTGANTSAGPVPASPTPLSVCLSWLLELPCSLMRGAWAVGCGWAWS